MAQQTRIEAMLPYFERFIRHFPDPGALAEADEDELMACWQGLGYYSRARNLQAAARQIMNEYQGAFPLEKQELLRLPGIGDYTAGAIASIAGGQKVTAVDGNVIRVFSRLLDFDEDPSKTAPRKKLVQSVEQSLPEAELCGNYNQALMELGALVCTPKSPSCPDCPVSSFCLARENRTQLIRPVRPEKKKRRAESREVWIVAKTAGFQKTEPAQPGNAEEFLKIRIRKRVEPGLLHGLYEFDPSRPAEADLPEARIVPLGEYRHIFTHREWMMKGWMVLVSETAEDQTQEILEPEDGFPFFATLSEVEKSYAIPGAFAPFLQRAREIICQDSEMMDLNEETEEIIRTGQAA